MSPKVNRFPGKLLTFFGKSLEQVKGQLQRRCTKMEARILHVL